MDRMRHISTTSRDEGAFAYAHYGFDTVIAEAAGNYVLLHLFRQIRDWEVSAHKKILRLPGAMHNSIVQHQKLLAALRTGNRDDVARAAQEHFDSSEHFIDMVAMVESG